MSYSCFFSLSLLLASQIIDRVASRKAIRKTHVLYEWNIAEIIEFSCENNEKFLCKIPQRMGNTNQQNGTQYEIRA